MRHSWPRRLMASHLVLKTRQEEREHSRLFITETRKEQLIMLFIIVLWRCLFFFFFKRTAVDCVNLISFFHLPISAVSLLISTDTQAAEGEELRGGEVWWTGEEFVAHNLLFGEIFPTRWRTSLRQNPTFLCKSCSTHVAITKQKTTSFCCHWEPYTWVETRSICRSENRATQVCSTRFGFVEQQVHLRSRHTHTHTCTHYRSVQKKFDSVFTALHHWRLRRKATTAELCTDFCHFTEGRSLNHSINLHHLKIYTLLKYQSVVFETCFSRTSICTLIFFRFRKSVSRKTG